MMNEIQVLIHLKQLANAETVTGEGGEHRLKILSVAFTETAAMLFPNLRNFDAEFRLAACTHPEAL